MKPKITQQAEVPEVPTEVLAQHIEQISKAMSEINHGPLEKDTIILLIHDVTKLPRRDIKKVLDACEVLANIYVKPRVK